MESDLWETVGMVKHALKRELVDLSYVHGIPAFGRCGKCGRPFETPSDAMANPKKATEDFHAAFAAHKCDQDASQAAARIVREATEGR
jgi:hypothetical protein